MGDKNRVGYPIILQDYIKLILNSNKENSYIYCAKTDHPNRYLQNNANYIHNYLLTSKNVLTLLHADITLLRNLTQFQMAVNQ